MADKETSADAERELHRVIALLRMQPGEVNAARALAIGRKLKAVSGDTLSEARNRMSTSALAAVTTDRATQASGVAVAQTTDAGDTDDSVAAYQAGYDAGRAGNESKPGPVDTTDVAAYNQGYEDGRKEAERTGTSAGPKTMDTARSAPAAGQGNAAHQQPAPQQAAPEQKAPIGPPVSDAYQRGVDDATNRRDPVTVVSDRSEKNDYIAGYDSVLRRMEENLKKPEQSEEEKKGPAAAAGSAAKTVGGGIADHVINQYIEHAVPHAPEIPWLGLLEMMTELKGDTPQSTPEEYIKYERERLQEIEIERQKHPGEDDEPDASVPDATTH